MLDEPTSEDDLGAATLGALQSSMSRSADPNLEIQPDPVLTAAGVKTWSTFARLARYCLVSREGDTISVIPSKRSGRGGGYLHIVESQILVQEPATAGLIGSAIRQALETSST